MKTKYLCIEPCKDAPTIRFPIYSCLIVAIFKVKFIFHHVPLFWLGFELQPHLG